MYIIIIVVSIIIITAAAVVLVVVVVIVVPVIVVLVVSVATLSPTIQSPCKSRLCNFTHNRWPTIIHTKDGQQGFGKKLWFQLQDK